MDTTALGIVLGLGIGSIYTIVRGLRHRSIDPFTTGLSFLAGFAIPPAGALIKAGMYGQIDSLPTNWREYISFAGVVAIGISCQYLIQVFRATFSTEVRSNPEENKSSGKKKQKR
jgi:hypothetical protein